MSTWRRPSSSHHSSGGAHSCSFMKRDRVSRRRSLPFSCRSVRSGHLLFLSIMLRKRPLVNGISPALTAMRRSIVFDQDVAAALAQLQPAESTLRRMQDSIILKVQEARDSWYRRAATDHVEDGRPRSTLWISASFEQSDPAEDAVSQARAGRSGRATTAECPRIVSISIQPHALRGC